MSVLEQHRVVIHPSVADQIRRHSQREHDKGGYEAVGFVAALEDSEVATATVPLNNHASNPQEAYFVEPWEQFRAEQKLEDRGYRIVGVYHSHPKSEALPSRSDHDWASKRAGEYAFLYSVVFDDLKAYREEDGYLYPVTLKLEGE